MNLFTVFQRFPDHESCIEHLEDVRWKDTPACPLCGAVDVARKADGDRIGRWNCHTCKSSFNVLSGTIFQKTKIPLQKWFLGIALLLNAKKAISSHQLARDLELNQKTAWFMAMRVRGAMADEDDVAVLLQGIVEADECYIGGKPRKPNKREDDTPAPRGRGTDRLPVIGVVERGGRVVAQPSERLDAETLTEFLVANVDPASLLITDQFLGYNRMGDHMAHTTIDHSVQYVDGIVHTNTIEGFWSLVKCALIGTHHHYTVKHAFSYIIEACFKYNIRRQVNPFDAFMREAVSA